MSRKPFSQTPVSSGLTINASLSLGPTSPPMGSAMFPANLVMMKPQPRGWMLTNAVLTSASLQSHLRRSSIWLLLVLASAAVMKFVSTPISVKVLPATGQSTQCLPAFPCYWRTYHTNVVHELSQLNHLPTLLMAPTTKQSSQHYWWITAMACVTFLTSHFNLGNLRIQYHHWHITLSAVLPSSWITSVHPVICQSFMDTSSTPTVIRQARQHQFFGSYRLPLYPN